MPFGRFHALIIAILTTVSVSIDGGAWAEQPLGPVSMHAEINAHAITTLLHQAKAGERPDLSGKFLAYLDLSDLDFKGANLARSDFYGTDFTGANLSGVDLSHTRLDRSVLIRANLSGANLTGATIYRPTIYSDLSNATSDAPRFSGANLTHVHVQAELSGSDFRGADLTDADFLPLEGRPGEGTMTTTYKNILKYCNFAGARLHDAKMQRTVLWFAKFTGADLTGANFTDADLSRADFAGADVAGADFTRANLDEANFVGAKGIADAKGLHDAINFDRAYR
ncbi:pentapeptide repeat-containing protein [Hyphomicrobium sp.]|jgi:uncharacterized protein YjbI with pentapeptide repeats|uniref:pentapeptide repeat-containing protein n=1 Tax=Hyphomicrobium sp. TaxID=82 RepID=UPI002C5AFDBF|nr:pentapeptide repeat-containing protein [Hyphomicrobium sp.]HVZ05816.1 pentapeptide repeat-containing protein [Hyphomicrobium sp.]